MVPVRSIGPDAISQGSRCHILPTPLSFGVPKGSVLRPSLFSVYTSPVPAIVSRHGVSIKLFSDETQEYVHFNMDPHSQSVAFGSLVDCATHTEDWFNDNHVKLNLVKSLLLYTVPRRHSSELVTPPLVVGDATLPPSVQARNLGVIFDSALSMALHVNSVCKCAFFHLTLIGGIRRFLDVRSAKSLVHDLVLSRIDYANSLLLFKSFLRKVQRVQNAAARLIVGVGKYKRISDHLKLLH